MPASMTRQAVIAGSILVLGTAAALAIRFSGERVTSTLGEAPPEAGPPVVIAIAKLDLLRAPVRVAGTLRARRSVDLAPEIAGRLIEVRAEVGDRLRAGAVAFQLDDRDARLNQADRKARRNAAAAQAHQARRKATRLESLGSEGVSAEETVEEAVLASEVAAADLEVAERELELAARALQKTTVQAPWDGLVAVRLADPGTWVTPGQAILRLVDLNPTDATADLPAADAVHLRPGDPVEVRLEALPGEVFAGQIHTVSPQADAADLRLPVTVELAGDPRFADGMVAELRFVLDRAGPAVAVPIDALDRGPDGTFVWSLDETTSGDPPRVHRLPVEIAALRGGKAILSQGLDPGQPVVTSTHAVLEDGSPVGTVAGRP